MISCEQHDYIEIACTFRYPINITLCSGDVIECIALDTELDETKVNQDGNQRLIILDQLSEMKARVKNPHFDIVTFK